ncbi:MBL fold metallo-hydrolase [Rhizobium pisi]
MSPESLRIQVVRRPAGESSSGKGPPRAGTKPTMQTPAPLTEVVREGSTIDIGGVGFTVLHLPGHSPGSIALFDTRTVGLFSGDAIYDGGLVDDLSGCDKEVYRNTMSRLKDTEVSIVYGGHGNPMSQERMHDVATTYLDRPV